MVDSQDQSQHPPLEDASRSGAPLPGHGAVIIVGLPEALTSFAHPPGINRYGFGATSALVVGAQSLRRRGELVSEQSLVEEALTHALCTVLDETHLSGDVTVAGLQELLQAHGTRTALQRGHSLEDLAQPIETGADILVLVNAGELWCEALGFDMGSTNHIVAVTGVYRDANDGAIVGVTLTDPFQPEASHVVDAKTAERSWLATGGFLLVLEPDE